MPFTKMISCSFRNLIIHWVIFFVCPFAGIASSQKFEVKDSINLHPVKFSKINRNKVNYQKPSNNFYKTDSIFSFRSQKGYFPSLLHNFGEQATKPIRFSAKQWLVSGVALGITATLFCVDDDIDDWATTQKEKHNWVNISSPVISELGGRYGVYLVGAIGTLSAVFKKQKRVQTSLLATQAMITSGVWVNVIKTLTGRERPKGAYLYSQSKGGKWNGPLARFDRDLAFDKSNFAFDAFPSGHTATAFSIATVFASQYNESKVIPIISYSLASMVGISRLTEHEHWASDVFAGALFGYLCGKQVVGHFNKTHQNFLTDMPLQSKNKAQLTLIQEGNQFGLSISW